ncbi:MAG: alpha/beta fold hydrolase [Deltaproteobacteria bacterium]|nr:alpha/beta fold hydrolase [Deltaproteobacteria bacterium]
MPHATCADGTRIHYETLEPSSQAHGDPVVLIQGLGLSSRFWFDIPQWLATDPQRPRRVITLDNRGTGSSDKPRGLYKMRQMGDDVAAVLDACGVKKAVIVGISMGGMIAMHFAIHHPERASGLVLLATTPGLPWGRPPTLHAMAALLVTPFVRGRRIRWIDRILLPEHALDRAAQIFSRWPAAFRKDPIVPRVFFAQLAAAAMHSAGWRLGRIRCPAVVVAGEDDILIPPVNARRIARRIPNAVLEVLPGNAHAIPALDEKVVHRALAKLDEM